jgi:hypothetical protein
VATRDYDPLGRRSLEKTPRYDQLANLVPKRSRPTILRMRDDASGSAGMERSESRLGDEVFNRFGLAFRDGFARGPQEELEEGGCRECRDHHHERDPAEEAGVKDTGAEAGLGEDQADLAAGSRDHQDRSPGRSRITGSQPQAQTGDESSRNQG